ncbi:polysaccharide pyruvyl transferase family protein [Zunongwangia sp. HRR-M8]|uniref:polysaccharide pyruvyl transferase family protein n=1 Tax=Zunongwangia sp. HRR-M8 TaxID=3015170 RepID=UPI0022DDAAB8|nr:polysaccharide pyruvyl transferase family protein [Zunongwangia sp. HRR-M8]WBL22051.1 polysaccharide pyruvyl transferase family protein [Zunongwangia sp. HRR-M8]
MRIGIMTTQDALNNGAMLQAFALQTFLESLGHQVEFINFERQRNRTWRSLVSKSPKLMRQKLINALNESRYRKQGNYGAFLKRGEKVYKSLKALQQDPPDYDIYIAGSDQIWNVSSRNTINRPFYLDFGGDHVKKIGYAASMGQCKVPEFMNDEIHSLLKNFYAISLRETIAVNFIQSLFKDTKQIYHTPDPTFLLSVNDYKRFIPDSNSQKEYIVSYILVPNEFPKELREACRFIGNQKGMEILNLRNPDTCIWLKGATDIIVAPEKWLEYFYYANFTICCSFHAVVFSLIFNKPFVVLTPYKNERIVSLLDRVGLGDRIVYKFDKEQIYKLLNQNINWKETNERLSEFQSVGVNFLKEHI